MKISEIAALLEAEILCCEEYAEHEVNSACGSDMMSDVLAFVKDQAVLITGLVNPQVIRTAEMMDIEAIIFVRGKEPEDSIIGMAKMKDMVLMSTDYPLYIASGMLYTKGLNNNDMEH